MAAHAQCHHEAPEMGALRSTASAAPTFHGPRSYGAGVQLGRLQGSTDRHTDGSLVALHSMQAICTLPTTRQVFGTGNG